MTYVDPSADLPPWARQGGAGPTGGPSGAPQGGGANWLQYLQQMFGGQGWQPGMIPSLMSGGGAQGGPGQQPYQTASLGWAGPPGYDQAAALRSHLRPASTVNLGGDDGSSPPAPPAAPAAPMRPPITPTPSTAYPPAPAPPAGAAAPMRPPNTMGLPPGALSASNLASFNNMPTPSGGGGMPVGAPGTMSSATPPVAAGSNATPNPRFVQIDRPNMPAGGGPYGRSGPPQMSAFNLAGLFGGGQGQPAVNPNAPAANAQPVAAVRPVAGPLASGGRPPGPIDPGIIARQRMRGPLDDPSIVANQKRRGMNPYS
jgi:hypothetical protein